MEVVEKIMSGTEETTPIYRVRVLDQSGLKQYAYLKPAQEEDMPLEIRMIGLSTAWVLAKCRLRLRGNYQAFLSRKSFRISQTWAFPLSFWWRSWIPGNIAYTMCFKIEKASQSCRLWLLLVRPENWSSILCRWRWWNVNQTGLYRRRYTLLQG